MRMRDGGEMMHEAHDVDVIDTRIYLYVVMMVDARDIVGDVILLRRDCYYSCEI